MSTTTYTRYELLRAFRNGRFFVFSLGFPLILFFLIAGPNRHVHNLGGSGIPAPLYFMVALAAFGTMNSVMSAGARISVERLVGWNRQLRLTPLRPRVYFRTKVMTAYMLALVTILALYASGVLLGVRLSATTWLEMTGLLVVGLIPFAALGIAMGHLLSTDTIGPAMGGTTALLGFFGGVWFPITGGGLLHAVALSLPSYWLVQASRVGIGAGGWHAHGWFVIGLWSVALTVLARRAYRRDTKRA